MSSAQDQGDSSSVTSSQFEKMRNDAGPSKDISAAVLVQETSFIQGKQAHSGEIASVTKVSDTELLSSSTDKSFKLWDTENKGCRYTIETFDALDFTIQTGEKGNLHAQQFVSSQGEGNFFVLGLDKMNQNCIKKEAHFRPIVQMTSLQKLKHMYFATRCEVGDVGIFSSIVPQCDCVYLWENVDQDENAAEQSMAAETARDAASPEMGEPEQMEGEEGAEGDGMEGEEPEDDGAASEYTDGGTKIEKKKVVKEEPKRDFSGRISSKHDQMIELDPQTICQAQSSTAVLCFTNYNEKNVNVQTFDVKTRRRLPFETYECKVAPTRLFQLDECNILVGREDGKIDHLELKTGEWANSYDGSTADDGAITVILELKSESKLIRDAVESAGPKDDFRLIVTASSNSGMLRFWKLDKATKKMHLYMEINTSLTDGIGWVVEMTDTQVIAASRKGIKILNFVDKATKEVTEKETKARHDIQQKLKDLFQAAEQVKDMRVGKDGLRSYFKALHAALGDDYKFAAQITNECLDDVWFEFDARDTGYLTWHQVKPFLERVKVHSAVLEEELRVAKEAQAEFIAARAEAKARRLAELEEERRRKAAEEAEDSG
jgi:hypothetical protein